jgi:PKD repeat protein
MRYTTVLILVILLLYCCMAQGAAGEYGGSGDRSPDDGGAGVFSLDSTGSPTAGPGDKANLTHAQRKLSTELLRWHETGIVPAGMIARGSGEEMSAGGVPVYIALSPGAGSDRVANHVIEVTAWDEAHSLMAARVDPEALEALASLEEVRSVMSVIPPVVHTGIPQSEGDPILRADELRQITGYAGAGMKIGIISNGVDHLDDAVASENLPPDVVIVRNDVGGDEGTAMLEIVHDLAPEADLYFHDCGTNVLDFNTAIDNLAAAGCTIICDDIGWITEPFFEDGIIADHIRDLIETDDILYVTAAGNDAQRHYQGLYYDSNPDPGENLHDFSGGTSADTYLYVKIPSRAALYIVLEWDDEWGASANDYDLYLFDTATGTILDRSENWQDGSSDPVEFIAYSNTGGSTLETGVAVNKYGGEDKILEVYLYPMSGTSVYSNNIVATDSIFGHAAVDRVVSVGAIPAWNPGTIESFSSRGPVTIAYPSAVSRQKPDICGIDGVSVSGAGGFYSPFYGTSASAPHVAAVAALVWGLQDTKSAEEITSLLKDSAVDLGDPGWDTTFGSGRADAMAAYLQGIAPPDANFSVNVSSGPPPLTVQFTDLSPGYPGVWEWDFGDNSSSTEQDPIHTYTAEGTYSVSLTVTNLGGNDTITRPDCISVRTLDLPVANFTANRTTGNAPLSVRFSDLSEKAPTSWLWDFGDGGSSGEKDPEHLYTSGGWYDVSLTVTNTNGSDMRVQENFIHVLSVPQISLIPSDVMLASGYSTDLALVITSAADGLSEYNLTVSVENSTVGVIESVLLPDWASAGTNGSVPSPSVWMSVIDGENSVEPGAENVTLGLFRIHGLATGSTGVLVQAGQMKDESGADLVPESGGATLTVAPVVPFPGQSVIPGDLNDDGRYEDINGNGRLDYNDVVVYYTSMGWIPANQPLVLFDYNENNRIDFDDVVTLYGMI